MTKQPLANARFRKMLLAEIDRTSEPSGMAAVVEHLAPHMVRGHGVFTVRLQGGPVVTVNTAVVETTHGKVMRVTVEGFPGCHDIAPLPARHYRQSRVGKLNIELIAARIDLISEARKRAQKLDREPGEIARRLTGSKGSNPVKTAAAIAKNLKNIRAELLKLRGVAERIENLIGELSRKEKT